MPQTIKTNKMIALSTIIVFLIIVIISDSYTIKNLITILNSNEEYITTLEKRNKEERIYKNEQFNNKQK